MPDDTKAFIESCRVIALACLDAEIPITTPEAHRELAVNLFARSLMRWPDVGVEFQRVPQDMLAMYLSAEEHTCRFIASYPILFVVPGYERCDFCLARVQALTWNDAPDMWLPWLGAKSLGTWAACDTCQALLDAGDVDGLVTRVMPRDDGRTRKWWPNAEALQELRVQVTAVYSRIVPKGKVE